MATGFSRIEDFIAFAKEGKDVHATIALRKQLVTQKVHPDETEDMKREIDMYLLIGAYTFRVKKDVRKFSKVYMYEKVSKGYMREEVSKVYMYGSSGESPDAAKVNISIANERLKADYQRLREANITFEEKYF
jgi:hypothetical protein